jgi:hypothetical protein
MRPWGHCWNRFFGSRGAVHRDKLDLEILRSSFFTLEISQVTRGIPYGALAQRIRPAAHYVGKADLRPLGIDALLHVNCKHGKKNHKLELFDVGKKTYSEIVGLIASVTDADPDAMRIMRIDLTADVKDVPVEWFKQHARFKFKRTEREYGEIKYGLIGRGEVETIMAGSRPNVFRIYNKVAESKVQFRRMQRKQNTDAEPLEFENEFGFKEADTLTRVERQCGGDRIPPELHTFGSLHRAPDYNPFQSLEIVTSGLPTLPTPADCEGIEYFTGVGLHEVSKKLGMQEFRKLLNRQSNGNAARTLQRYSAFFPNEQKNSISTAELFEVYRSSVIKQLSA